MNFIPTALAGVTIVEPKVFADTRGGFFESYSRRVFAQAGIGCEFVQDNESWSQHGVLRGLHCQRGRHAQAKLVRVVEGRVLDVAVDARPESPTCGQHVAVELSADNRRMLFIPRGFLHGFAVLSSRAVFVYKVDNFWCRESEFTVRYDDPGLNIDWQLPPEEILVSDKDQEGQSFSTLLELERQGAAGAGA